MTSYEILLVYGMSCSLSDIVHLKEKYRKQL